MKPKPKSEPKKESSYVTRRLTAQAASRLVLQEGWESFAENHHGSVYWNRLTGEIVWLANEPGETNAALLKKTLR